MRSSDFLFRLIKALSKGDRRNLKLFGRLQDGDKKYLQLFDAIDAQEEYDEAALLEQFKEERFAKQFSVAKNYLYNYILRTLHVFHHDAHADLSVLLHQIEILMGKNLYDQAQKLVRKAKHMATAQERFQELLYLLDHERKILHYMERSKEYEVFISEIADAENKVIQKINNVLAYQHIYDEVYVLNKKGQAMKGSGDQALLEKIIEHPLIKDPKQALSERAHLKRLGILMEAHYLRRELDIALMYNGQLIERYQSNNHIRIENNSKYIRAVRDFGVYSYFVGNKADALRTMDKLKQIETFSSEERVRVFETYYNFKIPLSIELGDIAGGIQAIQGYEAESRDLDGQISSAIEMSISYMSAYFYFTAGMFESALQWVNKLLNEPRSEIRLDLQCATRILNMLVHFELGNWDLLEYTSKSTVRFLSNRGRFSEVDRLVLRYLRQLTNVNQSTSIKANYSEFLKDLRTLLKDDFGKQYMKVLDIETWLEGKLNGHTMSEIFQKDSESIAIA